MERDGRMRPNPGIGRNMSAGVIIEIMSPLQDKACGRIGGLLQVNPDCPQEEIGSLFMAGGTQAGENNGRICRSLARGSIR